MEVGAVALDQIEFEIPIRKGKYDWEAVRTALDGGKAYVFPEDAKENSLYTGLRRLDKDHNVKGELRKLKGSDPVQFVAIPATEEAS